MDRSKLRKVEDGAAAVRSRHRRDDSSRTQPQSRHAKPSGSVATDVRMEIDLRGMTVDDALIEVDRYLDSAVLAGLPSVRIIHGKGMELYGGRSTVSLILTITLVPTEMAGPQRAAPVSRSSHSPDRPRDN